MQNLSKSAFTLAEGATHVVNWDNSRKIAFTLAEVLITLGIIGVVAAMTLPTVINNVHHKELETALKKQYSTLSQAILDIQREDDLPFEYESYRSNFKTELAAKYKAAQNCGAIVDNTGCVIHEIDDTFSHYKSYTGKSLQAAYMDDGGFIANDGTTFFIEQGVQSESIGAYLVTIDVNGYKKRPNKMGYDLFMFQITKDGKVLPQGADGTWRRNSREALCSKTSTHNENGFTCAYYAITDNNYFKKL